MKKNSPVQNYMSFSIIQMKKIYYLFFSQNQYFQVLNLNNKNHDMLTLRKALKNQKKILYVFPFKLP